MATGPAHYQEAELLLRAIERTSTNYDETNPAAALLIAEAQVHATLALAAAELPQDNAALLDLLMTSLDAFQATAKLASLQHAQMRGYLAEHLAKSLAAAGYRNGATR